MGWQRSQQTAQFDEHFDKIDARFDKIDQRFVTVEGKIDDLSASVAEAIESGNKATDTELKDHK